MPNPNFTRPILLTCLALKASLQQLSTFSLESGGDDGWGARGLTAPRERVNRRGGATASCVVVAGQIFSPVDILDRGFSRNLGAGPLLHSDTEALSLMHFGSVLAGTLLYGKSEVSRYRQRRFRMTNLTNYLDTAFNNNMQLGRLPRVQAGN
ncbi:hypothetical protein FN846DRAFT_962339 [Sphaerosporella brunnea]|uniref:Uncharacterized protein n=1 Tax=Sphaerosporella brunnea TaxID=1250544 RepID=A0A5J5EMZ5_9PEZI|nr:hypothetical protein FN846DRAFT_962339 [Sphaerosporella brunnea]